MSRSRPDHDPGPIAGRRFTHPDQVHFGAHLDFGQFAKHVRFQPNAELGFGDNVDLFTVNAEAAYRFSTQWDMWSPYLGGGIGANIKRYDGGIDKETGTDLGVNLLGGIEKGPCQRRSFLRRGEVQPERRARRQYRLTDTADLVGEVGLGLDDDSYTYVGAGVAFCFR